MKQKTKLFINSIWYKRRVDFPYDLLTHVFQDSDIVTLKQFVTNLCLGAANKKACRDYSIPDIIYYLKLVEAVINASYLISLEKGKVAVSIIETELYNPACFCGDKLFIHSWDYLPKYLDKQEFINPYIAIERAFRNCPIEEMRKRLDLFFNFAFDRGTLVDSSVNVNVLDTYRQIISLLEAAHLIEIRIAKKEHA